MVRAEFGDSIDIHLGGADLIFPHHENEIAQSETASGKPLARYWLHNGMVNVEGTKMSKSLGNFTTIRALLESGISAMTLRFFVLQAHYRKPLDFSAESLAAAATGWRGLNTSLLLGEKHSEALDWQINDPINRPWLEASRERFQAAMDDDLNTSAALAVLFELAKPLKALANRLERGDLPSSEERNLGGQWQLLRELAGVLGLNAEQINATATQLSDEDIEIQIAARKKAKANRNFAESDNIRAALKAQGIELIDKPGGHTEWLRS
jgi:cysteinyl-tRNA synthetase